jgi:hypothetical protein
LVLYCLVIQHWAIAQQPRPPIPPAPMAPATPHPSLWELPKSNIRSPFESLASQLSHSDAADLAELEKANTTMLSVLAEMKSQFEHYDAQAKAYERAVLVMRVTVLLCSIGAATALALNSADWARKTALVLSILAAAVPAADQIFQISAIDRISWRTAVDVSRLFSTCRDSWENGASAAPTDSSAKAVRALVTSCRSELNVLVDKEMDVSLKPLELLTKIEVK